MSKKNPKDASFDFELRLYVVQWLVLVIFVVLGTRFYVLQVTRHEDFSQRAENNRIREIPILAPRGAIYDRNGKLLVDNTPAFNITLSPEYVTNLDDTIRALVENLGVDREQLMAQLNDHTRPKSLPILAR